MLFFSLEESAVAQTSDSSYFGISGGAIFFNDNEIRHHDLEFDPGFFVAGSVGYIFGSVRTEGEVAYAQSKLRFGGSGGELNALRGTAGLYLDMVGFG